MNVKKKMTHIFAYYNACISFLNDLTLAFSLLLINSHAKQQSWAVVDSLNHKDARTLNFTDAELNGFARDFVYKVALYSEFLWSRRNSQF